MHTIINTFANFKEAIKHPYRASEFFFDNDGNVLEVPENENEIKELISQYNDCDLEPLFYTVNWENEDLYTINGVKIDPAY